MKLKSPKKYNAVCKCGFTFRSERLDLVQFTAGKHIRESGHIVEMVEEE